MLDYGSGWKEMWFPEPLLFAVQSLDQGVVVVPLGESFGIREDSEIELGRCHRLQRLKCLHERAGVRLAASGSCVDCVGQGGLL